MISVVVVNYNAGKRLADCIASVQSSEIEEEVEILVVDNASSDHSLTPLPPNLKLIKNTDNRGFATACNQGAHASQGDLLVFLNPDCTLAPDALHGIRKAHVAHPQAGILGGRLCNPDGSEQRGSRRRLPNWRLSFFHLSGMERRFSRHNTGLNHHQAPLPDGPTPVEAVSGAFLAMPKEAFTFVHGWDEKYFLHGEDLDLCKRAADGGWQVLFIPASVATHWQGTCSKARPIFVEWHKHRSMWRYYRTHLAAQDIWPMRAVIATGIAMHLGLRILSRGWRR